MIKSSFLNSAFLMLVILISCEDHVLKYKYSWQIAVTYTTGDIDTIQYSKITDDNYPRIILEITKNTLPCLVYTSVFHNEAVVCGVRKYHIISKKKTNFKS